MFSYETAEMPDVKTIEVEGRVSRAAQKAASFEPVSPTWIKVVVTVKANEVVGIEEVEENALRIFPNPATYAFALNNAEPVAISLYTAGGLLVNSLVLNPGEGVDVSALPAGLYMVVTADGKALRLIKK